MFTDDIGKYRKGLRRNALSSEIAPYRRSTCGLTRCTDDIAPYQGKSISSLRWISMFAAVFGISGLLLVLMSLAKALP